MTPLGILYAYFSLPPPLRGCTSRVSKDQERKKPVRTLTDPDQASRLAAAERLERGKFQCVGSESLGEG